MTQTVLLQPGVLWLLLLLPMAWVARARRPGPAILLGHASLRPAQDRTGGLARALGWMPGVLEMTALAALLVGAARPVERTPLPVEATGVDVVLALDVSSSMNGPSLQGGRPRMALAQDAAAEFVARRQGDRIGLLTFARYPDVQSPLTLDHQALDTLLRGVKTVRPDSPEDATGIGTAVARAVAMLRSTEGSSRVVIVVTDGEENVATVEAPTEIAPRHAAQLCRDHGIRVHGILVGEATPGESGADPVALESLSTGTGGQFFRADDPHGLDRVYQRIDQLEARPALDQRYRTVERFQPWVVAALILGLLGRVLGITVFRSLP